MRLKDYARNYKKRKHYVQKSDLLILGVDVGTVVVLGCRDQIGELTRQGFVPVKGRRNNLYAGLFSLLLP